MTRPRVIAVCASPGHTLSKPAATSIRLIAGIGVEGDAHAGTTVKHRSRVAQDPTAPNLRQVHLLHSEKLREVADKGYVVTPGLLGENVTTSGIDLLSLPRGTRLRLGDIAEIEITGLRNPCTQIDAFGPGLMEAFIERIPGQGVIRKAGVMSIVLTGGEVRAGDAITVTLPPLPHEALKPV
jgi:MOSC domain-containing protein YiiM